MLGLRVVGMPDGSGKWNGLFSAGFERLFAGCGEFSIQQV